MDNERNEASAAEAEGEGERERRIERAKEAATPACSRFERA